MEGQGYMGRRELFFSAVALSAGDVPGARGYCPLHSPGSSTTRLPRFVFLPDDRKVLYFSNVLDSTRLGRTPGAREDAPVKSRTLEK